jgi:tripartite-type tricarboxylate transporter receptor subunit TctC
MKIQRRRFLHLAVRAVGLPAVSRIARAQTYPSRPITIVVPFPAGGALDVLGRILAARMKAPLGQTIIVENIGGAGGSIGTGRVARAAPDGYTLVIGYWGTHVANGALYALPYDVVGDFEPIALTVANPTVMVSTNAVPARDLRELIGWLKSNLDKASAGTTGIGSSEHVGGILFRTSLARAFHSCPTGGLPRPSRIWWRDRLI